jgi:hypothetical protein
MAEYDLTKTAIPYLDRHLAFPLLAHLVDTNIFPVEHVHAAQYELAKGTNMVDYAVNLFEQLHPDGDIPAGAYCLLLSCAESHVCSQSSAKSAKMLCRQTKGCNRKHRQYWM